MSVSRNSDVVDNPQSNKNSLKSSKSKGSKGLLKETIKPIIKGEDLMETQSNILNELPIIVKSSTLQAGSNIPIDHQIEDWEQMFKINEHP